MRELSTSSAMFSKFRRRWLSIAARPNALATFDAAIIPSLKLLNSIKGVTTVFSCAGHNVDETHVEAESLYVLMAVKSYGQSAIHAIFELFNNNLDVLSTPTVWYQVGLEYDWMCWFTKRNPTYTRWMSTTFRVRVVSITQVPDYDADVVVQAFEKAVRSYIDSITED
jgi:hypothetical protein